MAVISEMSAQFTAYHRDTVCGKTYFLSQIKIIDSFDKSDNSYLEKVVDILTSACESLYYT